MSIRFEDAVHESCLRAKHRIDQWFQLLPEEYQDNFHGVSWSVMFFTTLVGFSLMFLFICHSKSTKRKLKDKHYEEQVKELQGQIEDICEVKIAQENELMEFKKKMKGIMESSTVEKALSHELENKNRLLEKTIQELKSECDGKKNTIDDFNKKDKKNDKKFEKLDNQIKDLERQLEKKSKHSVELESSYLELKKDHKQLQSDFKKQQNLQQQDEKDKNKTESKLQTATEENKKFKKEIEDLRKSQQKQDKEKEEALQEQEILKDCFLQMKAVKESLVSSGDEDLDEDLIIEKQKAKLHDLIDCARAYDSLKNNEKQKRRAENELGASRKLNEENQVQIAKLEIELDELKTQKSMDEKNRTVAEAKLEAITSYYAEREVAMQGKLGKEQTELQMIQSKLADKEDSSAQLREELDIFKKMFEESKREFNESEKARKAEIAQYEKKAHENWLTSREYERKWEEANRETVSLRMDLMRAQDMLRDMEDHPPAHIIRPRPLSTGPLPPRGPPPPFGRPPGPSPLPHRHNNGPPPPDHHYRSDSPRSSRRRPISPDDSLADERSQRSRPPSQPNFGPPSGPPPPIGPPPGQGGPMYPPGGPPPPHMDMRPPPFHPADARPPPPFRMGGKPPPPIPPPHMRKPGDGGIPMTSSPITDRPHPGGPPPPMNRPPPPSAGFGYRR